jgi:hypothetical protein
MQQKNKRYRYDTSEKKMKFLRKKGNIITFKKPFYPRGTANEGRIQIIVEQLRRHRTGETKIIGTFYDSDWYKNSDELINAIDWDRMEEMHAF